MFSCFADLNLINTILFFTPVSGLSLYAAMTGQSVILIISAFLGLVFIRPWLMFLPPRAFFILSSAVWVCSAFLMMFGSSYGLAGAGCTILGLFSLPALLVVPVCFVSGIYGRGYVRVSEPGIFFSILICLAVVYRVMIYRFTVPAICLSFFVMLMCSVRLCGLTPAMFSAECGHKTARARSCCLRLKASVFLSSFCAGTGPVIILTGNAPVLQTEIFFMSGLAAGPLVFAAIIRKKGIYPGVVLFIFLMELSSMAIVLPSVCASLFGLSSFIWGIVLSSVFVISPVIAYYFLGPSFSFDDIFSMTGCIAAGLLTSHAISGTDSPFLSAAGLAVCLIMVSVLNFFIIFSAWRHRFVLLK